MMAMASKFEDKEPVEEDDDDHSSFEEVQKPVERTSAVKPASSQVTEAEASAPASSLWKDDDEKVEESPIKVKCPT